jgi:hypothetical protein
MAELVRGAMLFKRAYLAKVVCHSRRVSGPMCNERLAIEKCLVEEAAITNKFKFGAGAERAGGARAFDIHSSLESLLSSTFLVDLNILPLRCHAATTATAAPSRHTPAARDMTLSDTTNLSVHNSKPAMDERKRSIQPDSDDIYPSKRHQTTQNVPQMRMDSEKEKDVEVRLAPAV